MWRILSTLQPVQRLEGAVKLVLRSGGKIENRDPFKRSPAGLRGEDRAAGSRGRRSIKEILILSAIANVLSESSHKGKMTDID